MIRRPQRRRSTSASRATTQGPTRRTTTTRPACLQLREHHLRARHHSQGGSGTYTDAAGKRLQRRHRIGHVPVNPKHGVGLDRPRRGDRDHHGLIGRHADELQHPVRFSTGPSPRAPEPSGRRAPARRSQSLRREAPAMARPPRRRIPRAAVWPPCCRGASTSLPPPIAARAASRVRAAVTTRTRTRGASRRPPPTAPSCSRRTARTRLPWATAARWRCSAPMST